jgi:RNA polymerase sigma-70 factor (ECF subfamily)
LVEWDALDAESRYALEPADQTDAEALYDRKWALELLARAMARLRGEFAAKKKDAGTFDALKGCLNGSAAPGSELAAKLGMSEGALKVAVHRLRQRYREVLRAEVAETVDAASDVDEEMRYLVRMLRSG